MLGLFDSGIGGLTVLRPLRERLPDHDVLYLGDQAHVPYGDRQPEDLLGLLRGNLAYLNEAGAAAILVACNTSCAIASRFGWPESSAPILDLIGSASDAVAATGARRIAVFATTATATSGAYGDALRARITGAQVEEIAAPALVPLVEAGRLHGPAVRAAVADVCARLSGPVDALVYGCTHYPVLDEHFAAILGPSVLRLDPAIAQADAAAKLVAERKIPRGSGTTRYATTGDPAGFAISIRAWLGERNPIVISAGEILTRSGNA